MFEKQTSIKLVAESDNRERAWKFSRPSFDSSDLQIENALSMDMGVNSLCMLTFEITSSVIFRDFLFSIRPLYTWARSSRDVPFSKDNLIIASEFNNENEHLIDETISAIANGTPQDEARDILPMTVLTSYTITMDFRTVCGLIETMHELDPDLFFTYGLGFHNEIKHLPGYNKHEVKSFYDSYALSDTEKEPSRIERVGDMYYGSYQMKAPMMAQFLRQSQAKIKTELWNMINKVGYLILGEMVQSSKIQVAFYIPRKAYHNLMVLRSHWFANWNMDMWGKLIEDYTYTMTDEEFWNFIPCGAGKPDPFHYHTLKRVNGDDHNLPCPIALEYPQLILDRLDAEGDNYVIQRYLALVSRGYIEDNPNNKLRIQYVS